MSFPDIDPIIFQIGSFALRWYAVAYLAGLTLGWAYIKCMREKFKLSMTAEHVDDYLFWAVIGVILGGRLGYVAFYNADYYIANPLVIAQVWKGGMSFHGGFLGVVVTTYFFAKKKGIEIMLLADMVAVTAPIGLFFGRIANFINGELFGRITDASWGVIFPHGGPEPRHPSQLYEAILEGLVLFLILNILVRFKPIRDRRGLLTGVFLMGYGIARSTVELFRQPDAQLGFLSGGSTMGQWLSAPMVIIGIVMIIRTIWNARSPSDKEALP